MLNHLRNGNYISGSFQSKVDFLLEWLSCLASRPLLLFPNTNYLFTPLAVKWTWQLDLPHILVANTSNNTIPDLFPFPWQTVRVIFVPVARGCVAAGGRVDLGRFRTDFPIITGATACIMCLFVRLGSLATYPHLPRALTRLRDIVTLAVLWSLSDNGSNFD